MYDDVDACLLNRTRDRHEEGYTRYVRGRALGLLWSLIDDGS
jgi:hypothetical protein